MLKLEFNHGHIPLRLWCCLCKGLLVVADRVYLWKCKRLRRTLVRLDSACGMLTPHASAHDYIEGTRKCSSVSRLACLEVFVHAVSVFSFLSACLA